MTLFQYVLLIIFCVFEISVTVSLFYSVRRLKKKIRYYKLKIRRLKEDARYDRTRAYKFTENSIYGTMLANFS